MSDILLAEGFGNLTDGDHTAGATREILGDQWSNFLNDFSIEDIGDGRKWLTSEGSTVKISLYSNSWTGKTELSFCFRIYMDDRDLTSLFYLQDGSTYVYQIGIDANGRVIYGGWNGLTLLPDLTTGIKATSSNALPLSSPVHVEVKVKLHNTLGEVHFYINGILDSSHTGLDTIRAGTDCDNVIFNAYSDAWGFPPGWKITDIIIHTFSSPVGDQGVYYMPASAEGTDDDFTPSAGADNAAMVDEIGPDEDATYNESDGTSGHRDSFTGSAPSLASILSVGALVRARKDGGSASVMVGVLHGGSEDQSGAKALSDDYLSFVHFADENPSTAAPWAVAAVSSAESTLEVV